MGSARRGSGSRERARQVGEERSGERAAPGSGRVRDGGMLDARHGRRGLRRGEERGRRGCRVVRGGYAAIRGGDNGVRLR